MIKLYPLPLGLFFILPFSFFTFSFALAQNLQWQKSLGGKQGDYLFDMKPTPDYGFILAGSSVSTVSGTKQEENKGSLDYYIWKMNEQGNEEWQKTLGGDKSDFLYSINLTKDAGYILGGSSYSGISADKKDSCRGQDDFWIIKLNARGEQEWQKTIGGRGSDKLLSIQQTVDLGYIVGGSSDSPISFEKTENSKGSLDFWVLKLDKTGTILWQRTLGGKYYDLLRSIKETADGYILAGYSNSPKSEDKAEDNIGEGDYWLVKLDKNGKTLWEKTIGGKGNDELTDMIVTKDGGYLLAGSSTSPQEGMKTVPNGEGSDIWIVKTDNKGDILWQQTIDLGRNDAVSKIIEDPKDQSLTLAGSALSINKKGELESDYVAIKLSQKGDILWKKKIGGDKRDLLQSAVETRDGALVLAGTSNSGKANDKTVDSQGQTDFWVVKLIDNSDKTQEIKPKDTEVYPNPTERFVNVIIHGELTGKEQITVFDMTGKQLQQNKVKYSTTPIDLSGYQPGVYVFHITLPTGKSETIKILKQNNQ